MLKVSDIDWNEKKVTISYDESPPSGLKSGAALLLERLQFLETKIWLNQFLYGQSFISTVWGDDCSDACTHDWVDTGMRWTYCRHCNADGVCEGGVVAEVQR